mgnify:CR=1 FL=1
MPRENPNGSGRGGRGRPRGRLLDESLSDRLAAVGYEFEVFDGFYDFTVGGTNDIASLKALPRGDGAARDFLHHHTGPFARQVQFL